MAEVKFFTDIHINLPALKALQKRGFDILRSIEAGFPENEDDEVLLEYATAQGRVLVTCDQGFERRVYEWKVQGRNHASILFFNMANGDCKNIALVTEWIELIHQSINPEHEHINKFWRAK